MDQDHGSLYRSASRADQLPFVIALWSADTRQQRTGSGVPATQGRYDAADSDRLRAIMPRRVVLGMRQY
jgi:hypothetical protein